MINNISKSFLFKPTNKKFSFSVAFLCFALLLASYKFSNAQDTTAKAAAAPAAGGNIAEGKTLFSQNCTACHRISDEILVGPGLKDVQKRRSLPWIINFVRSSQNVIKGGDKTAVELFNKFNQTVMPNHEFTDAQITSIVAYIEEESKPKADATPAAGATGAAGGNNASAQTPSPYLNAILVGLLVVLVLILIVLVLIISILKKFLSDKKDLDEADKEQVNQKFDIGAVIKNKTFLGIVIFLFVCIGAKATLDGMYDLGVQQGYAPTQPIAFSHKLHAGEYKIDCNYCHTGARKGKSASIPSANICMNCHNTIKPESPEIRKIFTAIEEDRPIQWVRIHNLPDFAYFNHSQHVKVGGLECQTCHGPIQTMEVVQQYSPLTMGWCINCHRTTEVNAKGNDYYNALLEAHKGSKPMTVKDIGGLECSKCHY